MAKKDAKRRFEIHSRAFHISLFRQIISSRLDSHYFIFFNELCCQWFNFEIDYFCPLRGREDKGAGFRRWPVVRARFKPRRRAATFSSSARCRACSWQEPHTSQVAPVGGVGPCPVIEDTSFGQNSAIELELRDREVGSGSAQQAMLSAGPDPVKPLIQTFGQNFF